MYDTEASFGAWVALRKVESIMYLHVSIVCFFSSLDISF